MPNMIRCEAQTWWKNTTSNLPAVLTPERAADYHHLHVRHEAPICQPLPVGTTYTPVVTLMLHHAHGTVTHTVNPYAGGNDSGLFPPLVGNHENEVQQVRSYSPYTVTADSKVMQIQVPFTDAHHSPLEDLACRPNFSVGVNPYKPRLVAQGWMKLKGSSPGARTYRSVVAPILPFVNGPVKGIIPLRFASSVSSGGIRANLSVLIDPAFHAPDPATWLGTILYQEVGADGYTRALSLDTTLLANGIHRLAIVADDEGHAPGGAMAVVQVIWFEVAN